MQLQITMTAFKIPKQAFFSFFHALEEGYMDKPCKCRVLINLS